MDPHQKRHPGVDAMFYEQARMKALADKADIEAHPWSEADRDLAREIAAAEQREVQEAEREMNRAQRLAALIPEYKRNWGALQDLQAQAVEKQREIETDREAVKWHGTLHAWLGSMAGHIWQQEHRLNSSPGNANAPRRGRELPPGVTEEMIERADAHGRRLEELRHLQQQAESHRHALETFEREFPALIDLRESKVPA